MSFKLLLTNNIVRYYDITSITTIYTMNERKGDHTQEKFTATGTLEKVTHFRHIYILTYLTDPN